MKLRNGFISNSSSTCFIITNKTKKELPLEKFVLETIYLVDEYNKKYNAAYLKGTVLLSAEKRNEMIQPGDQEMIFGDEQGDAIGCIFDYMLRDGGESNNFKWKFKKFWR